MKVNKLQIGELYKIIYLANIGIYTVVLETENRSFCRMATGKYLVNGDFIIPLRQEKSYVKVLYSNNNIGWIITYSNDIFKRL